LWNADLGQGASNVTVSAEYAAGIGNQITGNFVEHYYQINNVGDVMSQQQSQYDFAIIDFAQNLSSYGYFGVETGYGGGTVHMTGYPDIYSGFQSDQVGYVYQDPSYSVLDYGTVTSHPGNSGGPIWVDEGSLGNPLPYVVGVVSTSGWATQLTAQDLQTIQNWESQDAYLWAAPPPPPGGGGPPLLSSGTTILGTNGNDIISASHTVVGQPRPTDGPDAIYGFFGNDRLSGLGGNDSLYGGPGNDTLDGGPGNDWMSGGPGKDTFVFRTGFGDDVITDFTPGTLANHDTLELHSVPGLHNFAQVKAHTAVVSGHVVISDTIGDTITLNNVHKVGQLHGYDFHFLA
jgi:Ca2+-binding RTX toxin-like protein